MRDLSDVPASRNWFKTVSNLYIIYYIPILIYTKIGIYQILYKISRFKQIIFSKYATNLKTTISQRSLNNLDFFLLLFGFNDLKDLIHKYNTWTRTWPELPPMAVNYCCHVSPSLSHDQYTDLPLVGPKLLRLLWDIVVFRLVAYLLNMICLILQLLYNIWHIPILYKFDTVLYQFLETGTSDRTIVGLDELLWYLGFSLYPLSFFLYSSLIAKMIFSLR